MHSEQIFNQSVPFIAAPHLTSNTSKWMVSFKFIGESFEKVLRSRRLNLNWQNHVNSFSVEGREVSSLIAFHFNLCHLLSFEAVRMEGKKKNFLISVFVIWQSPENRSWITEIFQGFEMMVKGHVEFNSLIPSLLAARAFGLSRRNLHFE